MAHATAHKKPHVLPLKVYLRVGAALLVLTLVTVAVSFVHLGPYNLVVAMLIASLKATLVALFFMHLLYDSKLYFLVFASALGTIALFIVLTLFDTLRRGDIYEEVSRPITPDAVIYSDTARFDTAHGQALPEEGLMPLDTAGIVSPPLDTGEIGEQVDTSDIGRIRTGPGEGGR
ncbi:MAG: hypothetical protein C4524_00590 [Candidatus Zixiibacteriota bacterium]|nr:MAG: hypothetical protein C4524_00590 [candidate division Zixibacteria bacterium]